MNPKRNQSTPRDASGVNRTRPTFAIACWLLALLAFVQLVTIGTALAAKRDRPVVVQSPAYPVVRTPQPAVASDIRPRSLEEILSSVDGEGPPSSYVKTPTRVPAMQPLAARVPAPAGGGAGLPMASPRVEKLVQESRRLHLEGDVMNSMLKLHEAERIDTNEPAVIYQKGLLLEEMGNLPRAADEYQRIQQMGIKAGVYFRLAAKKLRSGMDGAEARRGVVSIGPMKTQRGLGPQAKLHANVSISLLALADKVVQAKDVEVQVHFYDKLNGGEIKKATPAATIDTKWSDAKVDWRDAGHEEQLLVSYTIPEGNLADEHLLGRREFYGYVVELIYKGEVVDQQASPRRLNNIHGGARLNPNQGVDPQPWLPGEIDDEGILPGRRLQDPANLPLPTR